MMIVIRSKQSSVCPECSAWMLEKDGWLKCLSCGFMKKVIKRLKENVGAPVLRTLMISIGIDYDLG